MIRITVPEPFSFEQNLAFLKRSANECMYRIDGDGVYKAIRLKDGRLAVVRAGAGDTGIDGERDSLRKEQSISVALLGGSQRIYGSEELEEAADYVREWFDLKRELAPFYELAERDPLLREPVRRFRGLRLLGIPDLFEALCWGIIGQQINLTYAYTLKRRLVESFGEAVTAEGEQHWLFPEPAVIAALSPRDLEPLRMSVRKCEYLITAAEKAASGELSKEKLLAAGGVQEAEKRMTSVRGIGPWTAHYVIMRCLRLPSAFPIADVGLHNAVKLLAGMDRKPTLQELRSLSAGWAGWEAYATFYLWRMLY